VSLADGRSETTRWPIPLVNHAALRMSVEYRDRLQTLPCRSVVVPGTTQTARPSRAVISFQPVVVGNSQFAYLIVSDERKMHATASAILDRRFPRGRSSNAGVLHQRVGVTVKEATDSRICHKRQSHEHGPRRTMGSTVPRPEAAEGEATPPSSSVSRK
jgi:hypothetical protein